MSKGDIQIFMNADELFHTAAQDFMQSTQRIVEMKGVATIVLSGGNTPKSFFTILALEPYKSKIPWQQLRFFFADERYVPKDNIASNYHMTNEYLFAKVDVAKENIYRIPTESSDPKQAAADYAAIIRQACHIKNDELPKFDLVYLGLGDDAHTASLMPQSEIVNDYSQHTVTHMHGKRLAAALWVPALNMHRITLTPPVLNHGKRIIFLVSGASKASAVRNVLEGSYEPLKYPAQLINGGEHPPIWFIDRAAAQELTDQGDGGE